MIKENNGAPLIDVASGHVPVFLTESKELSF